MNAFRSAYCQQCFDETGEGLLARCTACRVRQADETQARRSAVAWQDNQRAEIQTSLMSSSWWTPVGRVGAVMVAAGYTTVAAAKTTLPLEPDTAPLIGIILLCLLAAAGLVGMWLPRLWPMRRRRSEPDPHAVAFGDMPSTPKGRAE